jgi:hypothetical protein
VLLAGCGSARTPGVATAGGATRGASASASASADPAARERQFASCMRQHGVDMPDPDPGDKNITLPGGDHGKNSAAVQACQHLLGGKLGARPDATQLAKLRAYARCMRAHGIADFPDPDPATGGFTLPKHATGDLDPNDPAFQQAQQSCTATVKGAS